MGAVILTKIPGLEGQAIKDIVFSEEAGRVCLVCDYDRRRRPVTHRTGRRGRINRPLRRTVPDVPIGGHACEGEIEHAETFLSPDHVRVALPFVCPKAQGTRDDALRAPDRRHGTSYADLGGHAPYRPEVAPVDWTEFGRR